MGKLPGAVNLFRMLIAAGKQGVQHLLHGDVLALSLIHISGGLSAEEKQVQDAYNQYMEGVNTLARQKKAAEEAFRKAQQEIDQNQAALDQLNTQIPQMKQVVDGLSVQIQTLKDQIAAETDPDKLAQLQGQLTTLETEYQKQNGAYQQMLISQQQLTAGIPAAQAQLDQQKAESEKAFQKAEEQLKTSKATLESTMAKTVADAEAEIKTGAQELADGRRQIAKAKQELADGKAEYEKQKQEAEEKLNDAAKQITDGEETLKELEKPDWYVPVSYTHLYSPVGAACCSLLSPYNF